MKLDELVNANYENLTANDLYIWKYISNHKEECCELTIDQLASKCNVSRTTILRFAQKLSLQGYSELKVYLKWEMKKEPIQENVIDNFFDSISKAIKEYREKDFTTVCKMIYESKRVFLYGTGAVQRSVAQEMRRIFLSGHECLNVIEGVDEIQALVNTLAEDDLVIIISLKGESDNAKLFSKQLVLKGVPFISVTGPEDNDISRLSTESLYVNTLGINIGTETEYRALDLYFVLADVLFLNYMLYKKKMS